MRGALGVESDQATGDAYYDRPINLERNALEILSKTNTTTRISSTM